MKVLLFRGKGFLSALVRWQTRSKYSHAAILLDDSSNEIIESWPKGGVQRTTIKDWKYITTFKINVDLTEEQKQTIISFLNNQIDKKYDYLGVFRFLSRESVKPNDQWFCSELVFAALQEANINLLERVNGWAVSPAMLGYSPLLTLESYENKRVIE